MVGQDKEFLEKLKEKEEEVARFLFEHFYQRIFKTAYYITRDNQLAEDVVQETFLLALDRLRQLNDEAKINAWLMQIAINTARSLLRKIRRFPVIEDADLVYRQVDKYLPEDMVVDKEDLLAIWKSVAELPADVQCVFILRYHCDMGIKEISQATDMPEGTIKSQLSRGRLYLRKKLCGRNAGGTGKKAKLHSSVKGVTRV